MLIKNGSLVLQVINKLIKPYCLGLKGQRVSPEGHFEENSKAEE